MAYGLHQYTAITCIGRTFIKKWLWSLFTRIGELMKVIETELPGVMIIELRTFNDARGYFFESFQAERYQQHGVSTHFVQDNISRSNKNVLRGLQYQLERAQGKLVNVTHGHVLDVIVDVSAGSQ